MSLTSVEPIAEFPSSLVDSDGVGWLGRALGRLRNDGLWEGYLEFERLDGTAVLRTERETTQPNLTDLLYWASGLTPVYLEGAFRRAAELHFPERILTASNTPHAAAAAAAAALHVAAPHVPAPPPPASTDDPGNAGWPAPPSSGT